MNEQTRRAIAGSLGDPNRDFTQKPLTQHEIECVVTTYSIEAERPGLEPELREIYRECVRMLKEYIKFH